MRHASILVLTGFALTACKPPESVRAVQGWLEAYQAEDSGRMLEFTAAADRPLLKAAFESKTAEDLLPPHPLRYEIADFSRRDGFHLVEVKMTVKNPLPFSAKRVNNPVGGIPEERTLVRKFSVVKESDGWRVQLFLQALKTRMDFTQKFYELLDKKEFDAARQALKAVPPPSADPNSLQQTDRLTESLQVELKKRLSWTSTVTKSGADKPGN